MVFAAVCSHPPPGPARLGSVRAVRHWKVQEDVDGSCAFLFPRRSKRPCVTGEHHEWTRGYGQRWWLRSTLVVTVNGQIHSDCAAAAISMARRSCERPRRMERVSQPIATGRAHKAIPPI